MTREDLALAPAPGTSGGQPGGSPGTVGAPWSPGSPGNSFLPRRDPRQPIPVQNTLEYNDERIFSRFDFDP